MVPNGQGEPASSVLSFRPGDDLDGAFEEDIVGGGTEGKAEGFADGAVEQEGAGGGADGVDLAEAEKDAFGEEDGGLEGWSFVGDVVDVVDVGRDAGVHGEVGLAALGLAVKLSLVGAGQDRPVLRAGRDAEVPMRGA